MPARGCAQITVAVIEKNELAASYILGVIAADAGFRPFLADLSHLPSALNANVMVVSEDSLPPPTTRFFAGLPRHRPPIVVILSRNRMPRETWAPYVDGVVAAHKAGTDLAPAVRAVATGRSWLPVKAKWARRAGGFLTHREAEVAELARMRLTNQEIAGMLGVSRETVKFHLKNVYSKLGATGRRDLPGWCDRA